LIYKLLMVYALVYAPLFKSVCVVYASTVYLTHFLRTNARPKNNLGCNELFIRRYSLNQILSYIAYASSIAACAAAKIRYFSMSYIILLNNIRLFNFFVSVYYD
jgi:hypothetical protein